MPKNPLTKTHRGPDAPAWLAALLGAALFLLIFGPATLNPTWDSWIFEGYISTDILQHYTGWAALRHAPWALPLTFTPNLSWPFGGAASLADCVPLFALAAKLLSPLLPATFQYFGWAVLLFMMAMGYFAAKLLGVLGLSGAARVLGSALFAASPVMLERAFQHTALTAQFLVAAALWLYFAARRAGFARPAWGFCALSAVTASIHLYFVPMVLAVAFAACVDALIATRRRRHVLPLAGGVAACLAVAALLGFFTTSEYVPGGYGTFGANLNTFWNPASNNWGVWIPGYQNLRWSRLLPELPVVANSLDSFTYLGLGVLAGLGLFGIVLAVPRLKKQVSGAMPHSGKAALRFAKTHAGLLFSLLCLCLFAVSNRVTANSRALFEVPLPGLLLRLADTFRASGRLLWPVYYLLLALCCVWACKAAKALAAWLRKRMPGLPKRAARLLPAAALALVAALQFWDLSPVLAHKHAQLSDPARGAALAAGPENWSLAASPGRVLYLLDEAEDRPTALRAARAGMPTNLFLLARGDTAALAAHRADTLAALLAGRVPFENAVYLTANTDTAALLQAALGHTCQSFPLGAYTAFLPS